MIRVVLPGHLKTLARVAGEVELEVAATPAGEVTANRILDALEARYPSLSGTIRDHATGKRRPYLRFFACREDLSHRPPDAPLSREVAEGREPFLVVGAIVGG